MPARVGLRFGALGLALSGALALGCAGGGKTVYEGTYVRTWVEVDGTVSQMSGPVRLVLAESGEYEIEGTRANHPPRGSGHYELPGDETLVLEDRSDATGGYDHSLILGGSFRAAREGESLVLHQENLWGHTHHLMLEQVAVIPGD
jgi:hypothetical protein